MPEMIGTVKEAEMPDGAEHGPALAHKLFFVFPAKDLDAAGLIEGGQQGGKKGRPDAEDQSVLPVVHPINVNMFSRLNVLLHIPALITFLYLHCKEYHR